MNPTTTSKPFTTLYTKDQLQQVYVAWGCADAEIPGKGKATIIAFPPGKQYLQARIVKAAVKSTYGKALYEVTLSNPE